MTGHFYHRNFGFVATIAILAAVSCGNVAHAQATQGFGGRSWGMGPAGGMGFDGREGQHGFGTGQAEITVVNIPVAVLANQLDLTDDQTARITDIQNGLQAERQRVMDGVRAAFPRPDSTNSGTVNGNSGGGNGSGQQGFTRPDPATMQALQARMQAARQTIQADEQAKVKAIRAVLTPDQLSGLKTVESDVTAFTTLGIPVGTLADITLSAGERTAVTAVFQDARRQLQQAEQKVQAQIQAQMRAQNPAGSSFGGGHGAGGQDFSQFRDQIEPVRQEINAKALASLSSANRSSVEAYVKAHPAPQFGGPRQVAGV